MSDLPLWDVLRRWPATAHSVFKLALAYQSIIQGIWSNTYDVNQYPLCGWVRNVSDAQNDEISYTFYSKAGRYTLVVLGLSYTDEAISTIIIDGVIQGTIDWYNPVIIYNSILTLPVTIATDGVHTINFRAATRNVAVIHWFLSLTAFWFRD